MPKTADPDAPLRKGTKVVAVTEMRDIPEGTEGKVILIAGFAWTRYWVRFENGVSMGTIPREKLATKDEWKRYLAGELTFGPKDAGAGGGDDADGGADDESAGGGKTLPSGTFVAQKWLDRAAAARARLAA